MKFPWSVGTMKELADKKAIDDAMKAKLETLIKEFKAQFK
jgi:hypothetical protein